MSKKQQKMNEYQSTQTAVLGGKYYPRKMAHGWCVAHRLTVMGATIERFGAKCRTYPEAFEAAERMNREEAASAVPEHFPDARKEVHP